MAKDLHKLIQSVISLQLVKGVRVGSGDLVVFHLRFVDNTILFGKAIERNVKVAKGIMRVFELVLSLKINYGKSMLVGINVCDEWLSKMACILNCNIGEISFKYLAVPIDGSPSWLSRNSWWILLGKSSLHGKAIIFLLVAI